MKTLMEILMEDGNSKDNVELINLKEEGVITFFTANFFGKNPNPPTYIFREKLPESSLKPSEPKEFHADLKIPSQTHHIGVEPKKPDSHFMPTFGMVKENTISSETECCPTSVPSFKIIEFESPRYSTLPPKCLEDSFYIESSLSMAPKLDLESGKKEENYEGRIIHKRRESTEETLSSIDDPRLDLRAVRIFDEEPKFEPLTSSFVPELPVSSELSKFYKEFEEKPKEDDRFMSEMRLFGDNPKKSIALEKVPSKFKPIVPEMLSIIPSSFETSKFGSEFDKEEDESNRFIPRTNDFQLEQTDTKLTKISRSFEPVISSISPFVPESRDQFEVPKLYTGSTQLEREDDFENIFAKKSILSNFPESLQSPIVPPLQLVTSSISRFEVPELNLELAPIVTTEDRQDSLIAKFYKTTVGMFDKKSKIIGRAEDKDYFFQITGRKVKSIKESYLDDSIPDLTDFAVEIDDSIPDLTDFAVEIGPDRNSLKNGGLRDEIYYDPKLYRENKKYSKGIDNIIQLREKMGLNINIRDYISNSLVSKLSVASFFSDDICRTFLKAKDKFNVPKEYLKEIVLIDNEDIINNLGLKMRDGKYITTYEQDNGLIIIPLNCEKKSITQGVLYHEFAHAKIESWGDSKDYINLKSKTNNELVGRVLKFYDEISANKLIFETFGESNPEISEIIDDVKIFSIPHLIQFIKRTFNKQLNNLDEVCYYRAMAELINRKDIQKAIDEELKESLNITIGLKSDIMGYKIEELTNMYIDYSSLKGKERLEILNKVAKKTFSLIKTKKFWGEYSE